jgi:hypothetical protein
MTSLTERYLAAALRGIPDRQRADVERELRSSIADAVEDRVDKGEDRFAAETAVLEDLGDPARLAAGIAGRPLYLIGPNLFMQYRHVLVTLLSIVVPIVAVVLAAIELGSSGVYVRALVDGLVGALTVGIQICFWVTVAFALVERVDAVREARDEISAAGGRWSVERLPALPPGRVTAGEMVGEVLTTLLTIGGLLVLSGVALFTDEAGSIIPLFNPDLWSLWLPILVALLAALAALQVVIFLVGRWTMRLAVAHAVIDVAFAVPFIALALTGSLINPAFAAEVGWPPLAEGTGPVMLSVGIGVLLVTAWEVFDGFRRARRQPLEAVTT